MTTATYRVSAPAGAEATALVAPPRPDAAVKAWRRLLTGTDPSQAGAFALTGQFLEPGIAYEVPLGAVVLVVDRYADRWDVQMTRVDTGGLTPVKTWSLKGALGKRVVDYVGRRLPAGAATHRAARLDDKTNDWAGRCLHCRRQVPARTGRLVQVVGSTLVSHLPGSCPPPPEVIEPNRRSDACLLCGNWVARGDGVALRLTARDVHTGSWYRAAHKDTCPVDALPGPVNRAAGWCVDCGELVAPAAGYWHDLALRHAETCPVPVTTGPTWIVRRPRDEPVFDVGEVRRVRVDLRTGVASAYPVDSLGPIAFRRPDNRQVPAGTPGFRVLGETYVELVGVVVECVTGRRGRQRARVRPATLVEAEEVLAVEMDVVPDARPHPVGFMARWSKEKIGSGQPWLAEVTGRCPDFGYRREFVPADRDYAKANSKGTRGVWFWWTLRVNRVYEAGYPLSHSKDARVFLRATPDGDVVEISKEEVESWLNSSPVWSAS